MTVLTPANAFPNLAFPQHLSGQTKTVQSYTYPGAVWPKATGPAVLSSVPVLTTLDPSRTDASLALSGGNLVVAQGSTGSNFASSLAIAGQSTGKFYCEMTLTNIDTSANSYVLGFGFGTSAQFGSIFGIGADTISGGYWPGNSSSDGNFYQETNTATALGIGTGSNGQVVGMAIDLINQRIWYRINAGNWNGNALNNPATNVGGVSIAPTLASNPGAFVYPIATLFTNGANASVATMNFGATAFANSAPSGFGDWFTNAAFPSIAFPQHLSGQTNTVQNFLYPGAVQPKAAAGPVISTIMNKVFLAEVARLMGR